LGTFFFVFHLRTRLPTGACVKKYPKAGVPLTTNLRAPGGNKASRAYIFHLGSGEARIRVVLRAEKDIGVVVDMSQVRLGPYSTFGL